MFFFLPLYFIEQIMESNKECDNSFFNSILKTNKKKTKNIIYNNL